MRLLAQVGLCACALTACATRGQRQEPQAHPVPAVIAPAPAPVAVIAAPEPPRSAPALVVPPPAPLPVPVPVSRPAPVATIPSAPRVHPAPPTAPHVPTVLETAQELFASLSPAQRARAMVAGDDAPRGDERGPRSGLPIRDLDGRQQGLVHALIDDFTSPSGLGLCEQIASQAGADGLGHYLLAFMDPPSASGPWSWRVSEQHLTLVDSERDDGQPTTVGPVLLGTNPPVGFEAWEDRLIALYSTLSPDDRAKVCLVGKADSGAPIAGSGALVGGLSAAAQAKVDEVVEQRLAFFAPSIARRMRALLVAQGGNAGLRLAFWGSADKRCADGGKWDWKLGSEKVLIDYENNRGHIHTTLKASP